MKQLGGYIIIIAAIIFVVGVIVYFFGNKFNWLGNLPGDIKIEKENFKLYIPLTTMVLLSIVLTTLMWIIRKFLS